MLKTYQKLAAIAKTRFGDIVIETKLIGGTPASPNKLRLVFNDSSFLDAWLAPDGSYAYHWERRRQTGEIFRWDNAPHHSHISTYPDHLHQQNEQNVVESQLNSAPELAIHEILTFIRMQLP